MSYENLTTENINKKGNTLANRKQRLEDVFTGMEAEETRKKSDEKMRQRAEQYGRDGNRISELTKVGIEDRINAVPYNPNKYENEQDKNIYYTGFYENGNIALHGRLEMLSEEQLQAIGANDYISGVNLEELPKQVKENISYTQGYMMATIMSDVPKGKGRR